jgi:hypothetical protein
MDRDCGLALVRAIKPPCHNHICEVSASAGIEEDFNDED